MAYTLEKNRHVTKVMLDTKRVSGTFSHFHTPHPSTSLRAGASFDSAQQKSNRTTVNSSRRVDWQVSTEYPFVDLR
jgi:hypothetical protein